MQNIRKVSTRLLALALCSGLAACGGGNTGAGGNTVAGGQVIGLVLSGYDPLIYETKDGKEECPDGFVYTELESWEAQFPTRAARQAHADRCGMPFNRGPDCENIWENPDLIQDPLPYRAVKGPKAYGVNLDGTEDGRETTTTCAHRKFTHPDGMKGIDNQHYRLVGCQKWKPLGKYDSIQVRRVIERDRSFRVLLEIRGVDDMRNDAEVEAVFYQGKDSLVVDAQNKAMPWQTQRVNEGLPVQRLRGRIVAGELITEPADMIWSGMTDSQTQTRNLIRGMNLRLKLTETGAEGLRTGYVDIDQFWEFSRRTMPAILITGIPGAPAYARALHELADGYKDPQTGKCTALSSAVKLEFTRVHIRHAQQPS